MRPELFRTSPRRRSFEPCLATLRANVPAGDRWVHEIKWDGYRLQIRIDNGKVTILTCGVTIGPIVSRRSGTPRRP